LSENTSSTASLAADIVVSFVSNNTIPPDEVGSLIQTVKAALDGVVRVSAEPTVQEPAHALKKLVTPDAIFCAECGKKFKSLKRHLRTDHDLSPHDYRVKWGLKSDSPMVAPSYSAARSEFAKAVRLGQGQQAAESTPPPVKRSPKSRKALTSTPGD
jgi:predicted transcriptional regulator